VIALAVYSNKKTKSDPFEPFRVQTQRPLGVYSYYVIYCGICLNIYSTMLCLGFARALLFARHASLNGSIVAATAAGGVPRAESIPATAEVNG